MYVYPLDNHEHVENVVFISKNNSYCNNTLTYLVIWCGLFLHCEFESYNFYQGSEFRGILSISTWKPHNDVECTKWVASLCLSWILFIIGYSIGLLKCVNKFLLLLINTIVEIVYLYIIGIRFEMNLFIE